MARIFYEREGIAAIFGVVNVVVTPGLEMTSYLLVVGYPYEAYGCNYEGKKVDR